jgi:hypothetical protein
MARGGARPGAGRPGRKSANTSPLSARAPARESATEIKDQLDPRPNAVLTLGPQCLRPHEFLAYFTPTGLRPHVPLRPLQCPPRSAACFTFLIISTETSGYSLAPAT